MVQDISPHIYHNEFQSRTSEGDDILLIFHEDSILLKAIENQLEMPTIRDLGIDPRDCRSLFLLDEKWYSMLKHGSIDPPEGFSFYTVREYREFRPMEVLFPCAIGGSLNRWYRDNRFCGRCGTELEDSTKERALVCPNCHCTRYPKICPAVIVAVRNGDKLLLTRYAGRAIKGYALIAGYSEIGETVEQTVHREVMEEVGLRVKNLKFYKSQPWVFTDTLLMGFYCDLDGDEQITLQESELSMGKWISREDLPADTAHLSLTAEMIDRFRQGLD